MNADQIRAAINKAIETEEYESPVSIAYCEALRNCILKVIGKTASVEVYHHYHTLLVNTSLNGVPVTVKVPLV